MKLETSRRDDHQLSISVEIDPDRLESEKRQAARRLSQTNKIPGFRPGKAPYPMVARYLGEAAILDAAVDQLIEKLYPEVIDQAGVKPYGPGTLKEIKSLDPPVFDFIVPLAPEVNLEQYSDLRFDYSEPVIEDSHVDAAIQELRERRARVEPIERPAQEGDLLVISLDATRVEPAEGQEPQLFKYSRTPVILESPETDVQDEWPFPGFSIKLAGTNVGEQLEFDYQYSAEANDESLRGVHARIKAGILEINSRSLPALDEEFVRSLQYEGLEDLRTKTRQRLEEIRLKEYRMEYEERVLDAIVNKAAIVFPPQMVSEEIDGLVRQFNSRLASQGLDIETYLKSQSSDEEKLREEFRPMAEKRIRRGLVLMEVANQANIHVHQEEVIEGVQQSISMLAANVEPRQTKRMFNENVLRGLVSSAMRDALTSRTLDYLSAIARGENPIIEQHLRETSEEAAEEENNPTINA